MSTLCSGELKTLAGPDQNNESINVQVKNFATFEAVRLRHFIHKWCRLTDSPIILDMIEHYHVEFDSYLFALMQGKFTQQNKFNAID